MQMTARLRHRSSLAAAFWLLIAAWLCANLRPGSVGAALSWLAEGRHFTHQHRLTASVAMLLGGERETPVVAKSKPQSKPPASPALPGEFNTRKLEYALERADRLPPPSMHKAGYFAFEPDESSELRAPPLHGPPRDLGLS
jgi:hypothetical protein